MITKDEIQELLHSTETYRVERTTSTGDMDKFQEAICALANDLPGSRKKGYLILGAYDNGTLSGLKENDNQPAEFNVNLITAFKVEVKVSQSYTNENGGNVGGKNGGDNDPGSSQVVPSLSPASSQVLSQVVTSLSQVCHKLERNRLENAAKVLVALLNAPLSLKVLMGSAGESNRGRMKENLLVPLLDAGLIELTIPDSPNSPKQKYKLTEKGKGLFKIEGQS